jgi:RHS repeat-associated protein
MIEPLVKTMVAGLLGFASLSHSSQAQSSLSYAVTTLSCPSLGPDVPGVDFTGPPAGINDYRQIVGTGVSEDQTSPLEANYVYDGGFCTMVGSLPNAISTGVVGITNAGQIAGIAQLATPPTVFGFIYRGGTYSLFVDADSPTYFYGISNIGHVTGYSAGSGGAFIYSGGLFNPIEMPGDHLVGINSSDITVGYSIDGFSFINKNGGLVPIAVPGARATASLGINDNGIVLLASSIGFYFYDINSSTFSAVPTLPALGNYSISGFNNNLDLVGYDYTSGLAFLATSSGALPPPPPPPPPISMGKALGGSCEACSTPVGNPINPGTGNKFEAVTDYETVGPNKLSFTRHYNSLAANISTFATTLASNWRTGFDRYIHIKSGSSATVERADGQQLNFTLSGNVWASDTDIDIKLTLSGTIWTLTDVDDTVETYTGISSTEAVLSSIRARNGYTQTLTYNALGQLATVIDSYGRALSSTYTNGLLDTLSTPDNQKFTYGYNAISGGNVLTSVGYSTTPSTQIMYLYENTSLPFALTGIIDENGSRYATWTYDSTGRALSSQHGGGADLTTVSYNDTDGSRVVTNALGEQDTYRFSTLQGIPKVIEIDRAVTSSTAVAKRTISYDANGYLATATDWNGNLTQYTNDSHGQPTTIIEASGTSAARTTTVTYNANFHLPDEIVIPGLTTDLTYDTTGNLLTKTLIDTTTTSAPYSTNGQTRSQHYTWSPTGQLLTMQKPLGGATSYAYNPDGSLHTSTDAAGHLTTVSQHNGSGLPTEVIDANGVPSSYAYDPRERLISDTVTWAGSYPTHQYGHDTAGNLTSYTMPDSSSWTYTYDTAHRQTQVTDHSNDSMTYTLDALGNQTQATTKDYPSTITHQHSGTFDALGRPLTDVGGVSGQTAAFAHDSNGNVTSITDPRDNTTARTFDSLNRLHTSTDATGGVLTTTYDAHDRPLSVQTPNGATTGYVYDGFGDVIQETSPDRGTTVYRYDADANLTQRIDGAGAIMNQTFDVLDRPVTTTYPADSSLNVAYIYDETGHSFGIGRLTSVTDASGTLRRTWDERGSITSEIRTSGGHTLTTSYGYDQNNMLHAIRYPSGWTVNYGRDYQMRIAFVSAKPPGDSDTFVARISHYPFGPERVIVFNNGIIETPSYDLDYRMTHLQDAGPSTYLNLTYAYDNSSNPISVTDGVTPGNSQTFGYDPLDRLTSASGAYGPISWNYDHNGNRTQQTAGNIVTTYNLAATSNRLASITSGGTTQPATYNGAGDMTGFPSDILADTVTYNSAEQMDTLTTESSYTTYGYDAFRQRIIKNRAGSPALYFTYGQSGETLEANDFSATPTDYVYVDGKPVATLEGNSVYYIHTDRLGTPQLATDASRAAVWNATLQPFGTALSVSGSINEDLRFLGQFLDPESSFHHNGARDYIPQLGRYPQPDPIGLAGGTNPYQYANSNPVAFVDPSGLFYQPGTYPFGTLPSSLPPGTTPQQFQQSYMNQMSPQPPSMSEETREDLANKFEAAAKIANASAFMSAFLDPPAALALKAMGLCFESAAYLLKPDPLKQSLGLAKDAFLEHTAEQLYASGQVQV